jgi:hypothetical protein
MTSHMSSCDEEEAAASEKFRCCVCSAICKIN